MTFSEQLPGDCREGQKEYPFVRDLAAEPLDEAFERGVKRDYRSLLDYARSFRRTIVLGVASFETAYGSAAEDRDADEHGVNA